MDYTDINIHALYKIRGTFGFLPVKYCNPTSLDFDHLPKLLVRFKMSPFQSHTPTFEKPSCLPSFFVFPKRTKDSLRGQALLKHILGFKNFFPTRLYGVRFSRPSLKDGQKFGCLSSLAAKKMQEKKKSMNVCPTELQTKGIRWLNDGKFGGKGGDHGRKAIAA